MKPTCLSRTSLEHLAVELDAEQRLLLGEPTPYVIAECVSCCVSCCLSCVSFLVEEEMIHRMYSVLRWESLEKGEKVNRQ